MYQGIAKMHDACWFSEDKEKLEKVLLELWPQSKINPRKMFYYVENVKAFHPATVHEALGNIVAKQEYDRRPTINQLRKECQLLVRGKHGAANLATKEDCAWCNRNEVVFVGLYIETPERCKGLDITGKNVLRVSDGCIVRPDWGFELELPLNEYMVHCPHCSHPQFLKGLRNAIHWNRRYSAFTEFRCLQNGNLESQWRNAFTLYHRMISPMKPEVQDFDQFRSEEKRFHEYLDTLPNRREFEERKMNVVRPEDNPEGSRLSHREEEAQRPTPAKGKILPPQNTRLAEGSGVRGGDNREDSADSDEG